MSDFPKWLLALAGTNLIPLLLCPFFMFGGVMPFGEGSNGFTHFLLYLLTNLLWLVPILLFFVGLELYRRCFELPGITITVIGLLITLLDFWILFS